MKTIHALLAALFFAATAAFAVNDPPLVINYQGKLLNSSGNQVTDGTYTIAFKLYGSTSGTTLLWGSSYPVVVSGGFFNVVLGEGGTAIGGAQTNAIAAALGSTGTPFLGLTILVDNSGATINNPQEITPRLRLLSSPYSLVAESAKIADSAAYATNAGSVGGLTANQFLQPANKSASTLQGDLSVPNLGVNGGLTVANAATFQSDLAVTGTLSAGATTGGGFVPVGGIIMWSGSATAVPAGWHLCDGSSGTPDLRGRFIVGAGASGSAYAVGNAGGNSSLTLGANNLPPHRHTHRDTIFAENYIGNTSVAGDGAYLTGSTGWDGANSYVGSKSNYDTDNRLSWVQRYTDFSGGNSAGAADAIDIRPPYYALCYILRQQ